MDNDEKLWQGLRLGDKDMLLALYKRYYHCLLFIGLKEIKDAQLIKDTIHQLFLYLWDKRETIQAANNIKNYLVTSFLRKLTSDWKKSKKMGELRVVWNNCSQDSQPNPEEMLVFKDQQAHLIKMLMGRINELPTRQKELIVLRFYEGLDYEEIVQRTGLSHRTVYNKVHEGLKKLRSKIVRSHYSHTAIFTLLTIITNFLFI